MKIKFLLFAFIGMLSVQAQTVKKTATAKKETVTKSNTKKAAAPEGIFAVIATNKGEITVALEYQKTPITVANFISLAEGKNTFVTDEKLKGKPFFDGLKFHRVIKDFMIQGGDPSGNGSGGPGYAFKDEFTDLKHNKAGILSMANSGPATNGSQFFITHKETSWLDGKHTVFGHVTQGIEVVNSIAQDDAITKITIIRKGKLAKNFDAQKVFADYFNNKEEDTKKQAAIEAEKKKVLAQKLVSVVAEKAAFLSTAKANATKTSSGLAYKVIQKGTGVKPADGSTFYFKYSGYFEDGNLFDSSYEDVAKIYGKHDPNRAAQKGYQAFPFQAGKKDGMIPGFIEGLSLMGFGDKVVLFIPSSLAYGERGAGGVIPPNTNLVFELEMFEKQP
ncbi:peptidylprolyl isomerase [Flavobacterium granuli]|uniref:peptidylprolyl isomerase n=1 Tax=Flavobacterium granuli TaxID=280093 RepID=A0A1M5IEX7_9FLAO|nr:peptidylprolyl isomerase [Flavobacterium granuli]PRZ27921.1 cyclophilin family peptidyl-prolyl cis-trans isomerase [Flavobacterium granuli]SHG26373.1 Peptidyl-prolyl cis-trans isomerase (rotamase)-cyclophilin family [Flavobacterium granuli]